MKIKVFVTPIMLTLFASPLISVPIAKAINAETPISLDDILNSADKNYTRTSNMFFTSSAYEEVAHYNKFEFTQSRVTLWTENALYMHNNAGVNGVNSGYLNNSVDGYMYHYTIEGGIDNINEGREVVKIDRKDYLVDIHEYEEFGTFHKIKNLILNDESLKDRFLQEDNTFTLTFEEGDENLIEQFMFFIAPVYTNPSIDGVAYLSFEKVSLTLSGENINMYLYASEEDSDKLSSSDHLFASATLSNIDDTSIPCVDGYLFI